MYRLIVESLLGLRLEVDKLRFAPCLPADWKAFKVYYRYRETAYEIDVLQQFAGKGETSVTVDGVAQPDRAIPLVDDRRKHSVEVVIHNRF
jgi:cellobiose phosphorylase